MSASATQAMPAMDSVTDSLASPDGKTVFIMSEVDGIPGYSVRHNGVTMIEYSPLGIVTIYIRP